MFGFLTTFICLRKAAWIQSAFKAYTIPNRVALSQLKQTDGCRKAQASQLRQKSEDGFAADASRQASLKPTVPTDLRMLAERLPEEGTGVIDEAGASPPLEPTELEGMRIRRLVQAVDADAVNSWHFDTLQLQTEEIIAYLCQMFLQLNLVHLDPDPAWRRASNEQGKQFFIMLEAGLLTWENRFHFCRFRQ